MSQLDDLPAAALVDAAHRGGAAMRPQPARKLAVVTCMDVRIDPLRLLGLERGDAHVLRNAGGRATGDVVRSLALSTHILGAREMALIQHTSCGLLGATNAGLRAEIASSGGDASAIDFLPIDDVDSSVRADMDLLRAHPALPKTLKIAGFVYDVDTGELRRIG